ncbi:MAG: C39 family peptidase [Gemmatimonadota bacterium]|nr:MAG: C39 family peptidase [Gemmatimonadota bacterium]
MKVRSSAKAERILLKVPRFEQPDDVTCGPTCLAQVYSYYGQGKPLSSIINATESNPDGGTLSVYLGIRALDDGFAARSYSYNLRVFDPTWQKLDRAALSEKLRQRLQTVTSEKLERTISAYLDYIRLGGQLGFADLTPRLIIRLLARGQPVITGLNATYLYRTPREYANEYDDVRGDPAGHFVVISGYYPRTQRFVICDPSTHIPFSRTGTYTVKADRLLASILLGDLTYDAVLLTLRPRPRTHSQH